MSVVVAVDADGASADVDVSGASAGGEYGVISGDVARGDGAHRSEGASAEHVMIDGASADGDIGVAIHLACRCADR